MKKKEIFEKGIYSNDKGKIRKVITITHHEGYASMVIYKAEHGGLISITLQSFANWAKEKVG